MDKLNYKAGWYLLSCFLFFVSCSSPQQNLLNRKWYLAIIVSDHIVQDYPLNNPDTIQRGGSTDFIDFSDSKNYSAQLMSDNTNGNYRFNEAAKQIIRHNETTNINDTIEVKKLSKDTLVLYEKENILTLIFLAKK